MTKAAFKSRIETLGGSLFSGTEFSSLNAWGFDGWIGEQIPGELGPIHFTAEIGSVGTRHQGMFPLFRVRVVGIQKPIAPDFFLDLIDRGLFTVPEIQTACEDWSKKKLARR